MEYKNKVVYQIWPCSFKDSNNDGIGDIQGIISKLDYIASLGVDLIWLSPVYASPNTDYGYDISDYYSINPEFGTMKDFDELLFKAKEKGLGIIMDLVANHTSDKHDWFLNAVSDVNSPYRDYYFFKKSDTKNEPNNWISIFGGSAWQKDPLVENGYYLTTFTSNQCDLNWKNENVRKEVAKIMKFWLAKGIAGFRMDVINTIAKKEGLPSFQPEKKGYQFAKEYMCNLDLSHEYIKEMISDVSKEYDFITIGEGMLADEKACAMYAGEDRNELNMMITFELLLQDCGPLGKYDFTKLYRWTIPNFKSIIYRWQTDMQNNNYWVANYMNNHDQPRSISRFLDDKKYREESAKAFATLTLTLRGTPFIYQGEEIGMTNLILEKEDWRDYEAINIYTTLQSMMHLPAWISKKVVQRMTRDHARTPMQWSSNQYGGFSESQPWIKVNPNTNEINVENELMKNNGILAYYKKLIQLHKELETLQTGAFDPYLADHKQVLGYKRISVNQTLIVLINLSSKIAKLPSAIEGKLILDSHDNPNALELAPYESRIIEL